MSTENHPQAATPDYHPVGSPTAKEQPVKTVDVQVAGNINTTPTEEQAAAEKFIQRGVAFQKQIELEEKNTNVKKAYEGCLYILAKRQLQSAEGDKTQGEIFNLLLEKSKLKQSAVYKRMQFAQELINANVITVKMLLQIEEGEKASPEVQTQLDKRVGGKKGVEIQKKLGYLPSDERKKITEVKAGKTPKERLEILLSEIKKLLEDKELRSEVKDHKVLESLQTGYVQMESAAMKFTSIGIFAAPEVFGNPAQ